MNREEARKAAEVMLAYADGKEIEGLDRDSGEYRQITSPAFNWMGNPDCYRIKPQSKYRPFKDAEECWQEMKKHQPLGWVKHEDGTLMLITRIEESQYVENDFIVWFSDSNDAAKGLFQDTTFADGTPFGAKEE